MSSTKASLVFRVKATAPEPEWEFEQINFVVGNRRLVVESDFYTKLKKLDIQEGTKDKLFADYVTQVCEAHNPVGAKRYEANYRGVEGEHWAQCARMGR